MQSKSFLRAMLFVVTVCCPPAWGQQIAPVEPERLAAAKELLRVTEAAKGFEAALIGMREPLQRLALKANPGREADVSGTLDTVFKRMLERKTEALDLIAPLYAERFSVAELNEVIAFYKSATGAKFISAQPQIIQQSMVIGQAWGRRIGEEIQHELQKELQARGLRL
jgi:uncharacterized protein